MDNSPRMLINLLPSEVVMLERQSSKLNWINKASIAALLILVLVTAGTFGVKLLQNQAVDQTNTNLSQAESAINGLKTKEGFAVALKSRLASIQQLLVDNKKTQIFNLVLSLTPADAQLAEATIDKNGSMVFSAISTSNASLDALLAGLVDKQKNGNLIAKIDLESYSRGKDGIYHYSIRIYPK